MLLTTESLAAADAKPVKSCRSCHLQAGDDSATMPAIQYPDKPAPTKLNNEVAYHLNCNICHDKAIAATARFERQTARLKRLCPLSQASRLREPNHKGTKARRIFCAFESLWLKSF